MGLLNWLTQKGPGSPVSVAKAMHKAFLAAQSYGWSREDCLCYAIETRYKVLKTVSKERIQELLNEADSLGILVFLCIGEENPTACSHPYMKETVISLHEYFIKYEPSEIGSLENLMKLVNIKM
jgi:hypothetical protein